jgi:hypothetical protein
VKNYHRQIKKQGFSDTTTEVERKIGVEIVRSAYLPRRSYRGSRPHRSIFYRDPLWIARVALGMER